MSAHSPLEPIHAIQCETWHGREIASALCALGIPAGEHLHALLDRIHSLAEEASNAVCEEANQHCQETLAQTGKLMLAALDSCLVKGECQ